MRILLDACVPTALRDSLPGHEVRTAPEMGWGDLNNGALLDAMTVPTLGRLVREGPADGSATREGWPDLFRKSERHTRA